MNEFRIKYDDIELDIIELYVYTYNYGEGATVLRISCSADEPFESKIRPLMSYKGTIQHFEKIDGATEFSLQNEYNNFYSDFVCKINKTTNTYEIELTRISDTDVKVNEVSATVNDLILLMAEGMGA